VTSSRHIPADADLTYFTVTCHLAPIVADLSQDADYDPNTARIDAVVTFTPKYKAGEVIHSHTSTPPTGFLALPVTALIDDGYLKLRSKPDVGAAPLPGTLHGLKAKIAADTGKELPVTTDVRAALNYAPVRLLGNSATLEIDPEIPLYYDFTFTNIKIDGKQTNYVITGGHFEAPWEDTVIDLLDWMPLSPGPYAQPMVVGPQGPPGEPGPATVNVGTTTTSLPGSDAQVSNAGDGVNAVFDFVIPRGDVGPVGPAGGLLEFDSVAAFPAAGTTGQVYLAKDTGDTYRWDASAKALTYVRISERVTSTGIEDSSVVGRALVVATDEVAARDAIGAIGKAAPAAGVAADDTAALDAALADGDFVRAEDGTYVVSKAGVTVPAGARLMVGAGASIKLADGQVAPGGGLHTAVKLSDGASFIGAVDGNRAGQDKAAYNAGAASANWLVMGQGTKDAPLSNLHIDAEVSNAVGCPLRLDYVKDSYVRIRAKDCGGSIAISNCDNLEIDIEVDGTDNDGWKVWQHAVDIYGCTRIRGRVIIRDQAGSEFGAGTGGHAGLTMLECSDITFSEIDCEFTKKPDQLPGLGISLLSIRNIHVDRMRIVGYAIGGAEIGGCVDGTFCGIHVDGRYAKGKSGTTGVNFGVVVYNNGEDALVTGRTLQHSRNLNFVGGTITRCRNNGISMRASKDITWSGVEVSGCFVGLDMFANDQDAGQGPAPSPGGNIPKGHRFYGCNFVFNERSGVSMADGNDVLFNGCRSNNNSQATLFGSTRDGGAPDTSASGFRTSTGTSKTGFLFTACNADDTQGSTAPGFPDPARPNVVAVDRPERYGVGQTVTVVGAGAAGADLLTRVDGIVGDELTLQTPVVTFPQATLTGTIAVSGKTVTGTGTAFLTDLVGRAWVKVGADYRRIVKVASDTSATINAAFPADVPAGTALVIVRANVVTKPSQVFGYNFSADTVDPVVAGKPPSGNTGSQVSDSSAGGSRNVTGPLVVGAAAGAGSAYVKAAGPNATASLELQSKALGSVRMWDGNGAIIAQFDPALQSGNYLQFTRHTNIYAQGTSTDINVSVGPKGSGYLGILVAAGQTPTLQAAGPDAAHNLNLKTKGAGVVQASTGTGSMAQVETKGHTHTVAQVTGARSWAAVPANAAAPGTPGQEAYDADWHYVCVFTNTWKRTPLTTWT
jgi:hypothetical protein